MRRMSQGITASKGIGIFWTTQSDTGSHTMYCHSIKRNLHVKVITTQYPTASSTMASITHHVQGGIGKSGLMHSPCGIF